jgi:xylulokinase
MSILLGIDLGTSSLKSVLISVDGEMLGSGQWEYPIAIPEFGAAEQDPADWIQALIFSIHQALKVSGIEPNQLEGIGISGQMHGMVCLDEGDHVVRPAIIWADQRSQKQVQYVHEYIGKENLGNLTANPLATGFMLSSWLWLRENEPEIAQKTKKLLLPKDFLRFYLVGEWGTDPSDACGTAMFDVRNNNWSLSLLEALDIDQSMLPTVFPSSKIAGGLRSMVADELGLPNGIPVVYGGGDQAVQALANGLVSEGELSCTIGTGGQLLSPVRTPRHDPKLRLHCFNHVVPDLWFLEAAILSAGLSLRWLRDALKVDLSYQELTDTAVEAGGSKGLYFLPHLIGERTPYMDPESRAMFWGLTLEHGLGQLVSAVLEGVVFALKECFDVMSQLEICADKVIVSGGGGKHKLWLQTVADVFDLPVYRTQQIEAAAIGAALLAGLGTGEIANLEEAASWMNVRDGQPIRPKRTAVEVYRRKYQIWKQLYQAGATIKWFEK